MPTRKTDGFDDPAVRLSTRGPIVTPICMLSIECRQANCAIARDEPLYSRVDSLFTVSVDLLLYGSVTLTVIISQAVRGLLFTLCGREKTGREVYVKSCSWLNRLFKYSLACCHEGGEKILQ